jgi:hypothetical protein
VPPKCFGRHKCGSDRLVPLTFPVTLDELPLEFAPAPIAKRAKVRLTGFLVANSASVADVDKPAGDVGVFVKVMARANPVIAIGSASAGLTISGDTTYGPEG